MQDCVRSNEWTMRLTRAVRAAPTSASTPAIDTGRCLCNLLRLRLLRLLRLRLFRLRLFRPRLS